MFPVLMRLVAKCYWYVYLFVVREILPWPTMGACFVRRPQRLSRLVVVAEAKCFRVAGWVGREVLVCHGAVACGLWLVA